MMRSPKRFSSLVIAVLLIAMPAYAQQGAVRIIQTNAAGDNVHIIDPEINEVVEIIHGIPKAHGVTSAPDGSTLYFSNEIDRTLDIVPWKLMSVTGKIPLSGRPNNIAITPDGSKVYVAIVADGAYVDVIDIKANKLIMRYPTGRRVGNIHHRHAIGGGLVEDGLKARHLVRLGGHDQLAALGVVDLVQVEEGIHQSPPDRAETRLQRAGRIVEPAVDHLGIARRDALADVALLFQHRHDQAAPGEGVAAGQAHGPRPNNDGVEIEVLGHLASPNA